MQPTDTSGANSVDVRAQLVETLNLDLIGPTNDHAFARELLPEPPTRWYLTGFLTPTDAPMAQRFDETSPEEIDSPAEPGGLDDDADPDRQAASTSNRRSLLPSSMGVSVLVPANTSKLSARVSWGDYAWQSPEGEHEPVIGEPESQADGAGHAEGRGEGTAESQQSKKEGGNGAEGGKSLRGWCRTPHSEVVALDLPSPSDKPTQMAVPNSNGLVLIVTVRATVTHHLPEGTKAVSVFLVNSRTADEERPYHAFAFQCGVELTCGEGFVARPDPRSWELEDEWDQRVADLQYRDVCEYAVGHGVSPAWDETDGRCETVRTTWIPSAEVERVAPSQIAGVELGMEELGALADGAEAEAKLLPLVEHYRQWIRDQRAASASFTGSREQTAKDMLAEAETAAARIETGIKLLANEEVLEAFRLANRAVATAFRQRQMQNTDHRDPSKIDAPQWRPFQLAYLLMTIRGVAEPTCGDREVVDLLFFPTGGGKTEAYLALAAFALVLRRLRSKDVNGKPSIGSAGVSVLMRYTMRLLTLDQLSRAAGLICALELERQQNEDLLGSWPFEIGLWVGQAATPNTMGFRGDKSSRRPYTAYTKTTQFQRDDRKPSPIPLEECPWCGTKFTRHSFRLIPDSNRPADLRVHCANHKCTFHGDKHLPIVAVDEPIYRRLPCFLIATVDKFAALPWTGHTGTLLGKVNRYDANGFYGPCDPDKGMPLPGGELPAPDVIIQDELHLISGPLGTVAGLYETVIDTLATRQVNGRAVRPKIIASTATVRRADSQIRALFGRSRVAVFPPPGPNRLDSFFAKTISPSESPARLYVGVAAQGRSLKVVLLRAGLALLSAGQKAWQDIGGKAANPNPADPYMTLLGYFNSLRELGGSRRIIEDEVRTRLAEYGRRKRREPDDTIFADRMIAYDVVELTSRVSTNDIATAKRRLSLDFDNKERVDAALATNMISVGLDIVRLGLMVVLGQPKTSSEYIQATSRVGRDPDRPGLVVTLLNIHKPRDRSHYERFAAYHASFYRNVEATSVTPFSPRALDRALPAALVALCRQEEPELTPPRGAHDILTRRSDLDRFAQVIAERARNHKSDMTDDDRRALYSDVLHRCGNLLDDWLKIAKQAQDESSSIQYQKEANSPPRRLIYEFLHPDLPNLHPIQRRFRANRSMRDVESPVEIFVKNLNDWGERNDG